MATAGASGGAGRTDIWSVGLVIFESSPVIGVGFGNFPVAYTPQMVIEADVGFSQGAYRDPHNLVVSTSAELGLVGLALLGLFLVPLACERAGGRTSRSSEPSSSRSWWTASYWTCSATESRSG